MPQVKRKAKPQREGWSKRLLAAEKFVESAMRKIAQSQVEFEIQRRKDAKMRAEEEAKMRAAANAEEAKYAKRRAEEEAKYTKMRAEEEAKMRAAANAEEVKMRAAANAEEVKMRAAANAELAKWRKEEEAQAAKRSKEIDEKINQLTGGVHAKLAALAEDLVSRFLVPLLKERGIKIERTIRNSEGVYKGGKLKGQSWEIDNIAINGDELVVGEVKSRLRINDVRGFVRRTLQQFEYMMPEYKGRTLYGSVAALRIDKPALALANELGIFVIQLTSGAAEIKNQKNFTPKKY